MKSWSQGFFQKTLDSLNNTLAGQTLLQMTLRLTLIIGISTLAASYHLSTVVKEQTTETLDKYISERGARESATFLAAEDSHQSMVDNFIIRYAKFSLNEKQTRDRFDKIVKKYPDGLLRNSDKYFDGLLDTGVFIGLQRPGKLDAKPITSFDFQKKLLVSLDVVNQFGLPMHASFQDTYFTFPENTIAIYWPEDPKWVMKAMSDLNITDEVYYKVATPLLNPKRKTMWTNIFFDKVGKMWMLTASTPIYNKDTFLGVVHHDIMISDLLNRTLSDHLGGATNFMISQSGDLIAHPKFMKEIQAQDGNLNMAQVPDEQLSQIWNLLKKETKDHGTFETAGLSGVIVGYTKVSGPGWYYVSIYPKMLIWQAAITNAKVVLYSGLFSLLIELLLIYFVLLRKVRAPLNRLIGLTNKVSKGSYDVNIENFERNEIGDLAEAFKMMLAKIRERDAKIENHTTNLEQLVKERTDELEKQRLVSLQASKMSLLGEMAGGMAHEINTPLAVVKLLTERSLEELDCKEPNVEILKKDLTKINSTTDRMAKIIKSLRVFARDGSVDKIEVQSVATLFEDTIQLCNEKLKSNGVSLGYKINPPDLTLNCQAVQISQVLLNLITNAFDAIQNLPEKWISVTAEADEKDVVIIVTDSGTGISSEIAQKIFNPFFTTKDVGKGTGMGLSISVGIVTGHKGTLVVNHDHPHTQFVLRLPRV